ncbi:WD repeat-containing protein 76 [Paroedura picta]|uniref:WD repeat-containing protein 76 n=1 Tax=Paroedura picta TaxID=143630 RepID=UPI00405643D0
MALHAGQEDAARPLSAYERQRLRNVQANAEFFASLQLFQSAAKLRQTTTKAPRQGVKRAQRAKGEAEPALRRSKRLKREDPLGVPLPEKPKPAEAPVEEHPRVPPGPIPMVPVAEEERPEQVEEFLSRWAKLSQVSLPKTEMTLPNLESYKAGLRGMALQEDGVAKVVRSRIYSVAIHPSASCTLVAAGDKEGHVGMWNLDCPVEDGLHAFLPHSRPVSCLLFSLADPAHLLSLSLDGTVRCGDVTHAVFDEVYRNDDSALSSFDFLSGDASTLVVGMWDAGVAVVDRRTPGTSTEISADLNSVTRTVHVHPVKRQYLMAAGARNVSVYDVRQLKRSGSQPAVSLVGHSKSVASAYFSPATGNRVVTTCADDTLRIFGTNCLSSVAPILATIRHDNRTGRWLTRFRAEWDPKRDDCCVVGSMSRPRRIEVFHATGALVHSFASQDHLGSVCSISACHPTRYIVAGGNASGRLHVFKA